MPSKKKPTMKEMEAVINNIINDIRVVNQKADASFWGLKNFVHFSGKEDEFNKWLTDMKEQAEKEHNERIKSDKASTKTDSKQSTK